LFIYLLQKNIVYCFEKNYNNINKFLKLLINYVNISCYSIITITINKKILYSFCNTLKVNLYFRKIYKKIEKQIQNTAENLKNLKIIY